MFLHSQMEGISPRNPVDVLIESLNDHPQSMAANNEVRYKLLIDPSEDDSVIKLLFSCNILSREMTRLYMCSDFPEDGHLQKVEGIRVSRLSMSR